MSSVRLEQLTKIYDEAPAVENLTLECRDGEFIVILGRPGAGKTTTLKMVAGVEAPTNGDIYIGDQRVNTLAPEKRNAAMAFESYALYPHWKVRQNLEFPLQAPGRELSAAQRSARIQRVADLLEIGHLMERKPSQLSGGQRQRVSLGRALVRSAAVTLLDEPIAHLDARLRHSLRGELKHYQREMGATTIYTTPDYAEASAIADRIAVLMGGRLHQYDTPENVYDRPADLDVALMVGDPKMNILTVAKDEPVIPVNGSRIPVPWLETTVRYIGIRPASIELSPSDKQGAIPARVYVTEPMGYDQVVRVEAGEHLISITAPLAGHSYQIGQPVWLVPDWEASHTFDAEGRRVRGGQERWRR